MSPESLWIKLPEIIGIPLVALFIIIFIKAATTPVQYGNENAVDIGMDLSILAAGACGSIFANDTLYKKWGIGLNVYGILVVLLCIAFVVILARAKRWRNQPPISKGLAAWRIAYGAIPIGLVTVLLILGYTVTPGR
jgi:hypothetical protein